MNTRLNASTGVPKRKMNLFTLLLFLSSCYQFCLASIHPKPQSKSAMIHKHCILSRSQNASVCVKSIQKIIDEKTLDLAASIELQKLFLQIIENIKTSEAHYGVDFSILRKNLEKIIADLSDNIKELPEIRNRITSFQLDITSLVCLALKGNDAESSSKSGGSKKQQKKRRQRQRKRQESKTDNIRDLQELRKIFHFPTDKSLNEPSSKPEGAFKVEPWMIPKGKPKATSPLKTETSLEKRAKAARRKQAKKAQEAAKAKALLDEAQLKAKIAAIEESDKPQPFYAQIGSQKVFIKAAPRLTKQEGQPSIEFYPKAESEVACESPSIDSPKSQDSRDVSASSTPSSTSEDDLKSEPEIAVDSQSSLDLVNQMDELLDEIKDRCEALPTEDPYEGLEAPLPEYTLFGRSSPIPMNEHSISRDLVSSGQDVDVVIQEVANLQHQQYGTLKPLSIKFNTLINGKRVQSLDDEDLCEHLAAQGYYPYELYS